MTLLLAIDPGEKRCGYAAVETLAGGDRVRFLEAGDFEAARPAFVELLRARPYAAVAIEQPAGFVFDPFRGPALLATASAAGGIAWTAEARGLDVVRLTAAEVRRMLLGSLRLSGRARKGDLDKMVAMVLPGVVDGLPRRTNVHVRDALALAVAAHWQARGAAAAAQQGHGRAGATREASEAPGERNGPGGPIPGQQSA